MTILCVSLGDATPNALDAPPKLRHLAWRTQHSADGKWRRPSLQ